MGENVITIPDIGGATSVDVIEILVKPGDSIGVDTSLVTLESDKASMEIPSPFAGVVKEIFLKIGDKVSEGDKLLVLLSDEVSDGGDAKGLTATEPVESPEPISKPEQTEPEVKAPLEQASQLPLSQPLSSTKSAPLLASTTDMVLAGPAVRRMARELGVDLTAVKGNGEKDRITKQDVADYVKARLQQNVSNGNAFLPSVPVIDFSQFGSIEVKPLNKIKRVTALHMHRSWVNIPHVTQFDEADITSLESFRKSEQLSLQGENVKLTLLAFVVKAITKALKKFPSFNASLDPGCDNLIYKQYMHIGIAVETPAGLVVPVIKNADTLSVLDIAIEMTRLSQKAREKTIMPSDMSGGSFTISSLGGIGGTAFTPIVNSPEVAILGLSRAVMKPVYDGKEFKPRLMLPLSLSYDHRVIDGAEAARFITHVGHLLQDIRRVIL